MIKSIKTYLIGFAAFAGLIMLAVIQFLSRKVKKLEHDNSVFSKVEEIRAEQEIEKERIINSESRRIDDKVKDIEESDKSDRDKLRDL